VEQEKYFIVRMNLVQEILENINFPNFFITEFIEVAVKVHSGLVRVFVRGLGHNFPGQSADFEFPKPTIDKLTKAGLLARVFFQPE
jgi:hypothetical protein